MSLVPQGLTNDLRTTLNGFFAASGDTATSSRTSATVACLVHDEPKLLSIERGFRVRSYEIDVPQGTDYVAGDILTLNNNDGTFAVQQTLQPLSFPLCLQLICVPTSLKLACPMATEVATFQHPTTLATTPAPVFVISHLDDLQLFGTTPAYPWMVVFESGVTYSGGGKIGANHRLMLASVFGTDTNGNPRAGVISKPRPVLHGLPFVAAFVKELGG